MSTHTSSRGELVVKSPPEPREENDLKLRVKHVSTLYHVHILHI